MIFSEIKFLLCFVILFYFIGLTIADYIIHELTITHPNNQKIKPVYKFGSWITVFILILVKPKKTPIKKTTIDEFNEQYNKKFIKK
jgi:hypothetical protein